MVNCVEPAHAHTVAASSGVTTALANNLSAGCEADPTSCDVELKSSTLDTFSIALTLPTDTYDSDHCVLMENVLKVFVPLVDSIEDDARVSTHILGMIGSLKGVTTIYKN